MIPIRYCYGRAANDASPTLQQAPDFAAFTAEILRLPKARTRESRTYICGPMRPNGAGNGSGHRCKAGLLPRAWLALDLDGGSREECDVMLLRLADYLGVAWTTARSTPECPRIRILVALTRLVDGEEGERLGPALASVLGAGLASLQWDPSTYKGEQECFLPMVGAATMSYSGEPVDVDAVLAFAPKEEQRRRPAAGPDPYRTALIEQGLWLWELAPGKDAITCPFAGEHSEVTSDSSTVYFWPRFGGYQWGGVYCLHAHCAARNKDQREYLERLGLDPRAVWREQGRAGRPEQEEARISAPKQEEPARRKGSGADPKPEPSDTLSAPSGCFVLPGNGVTISGCAADIFGELARKKTTFVRSGVVSELSSTKHGHALCAVSPASFRSRIERYKSTYAWIKTRRGKLALCPKPCSEDIAKALLVSLDARELLPPVDLVLATPILVEREGRLESLGRGYHERERLLITKGELPLPVELGVAIRSLRDLLSDFLFPTSSDRSRALASVITPALTMGGLLGGYAPLEIAEATAPQSGKGYRQKLTHAVYGERAYTVARRQGGVGSIDESLGMALFSGKPFILIDNIRGLLDSQYLESIITCPEEVAVRIPRREEIQIDASRVTFQLTSNGAEITPDLAARSCITRIRKQLPGYKFRVHAEGDLLDHVRKNQPHYLGCVFAVVTEWYAQGKPTIRGSSHDFREWAEALDWIVQRLFKATPLLEGHGRAQERASDLALTWLRHVCVAAAKTNQLGVELSASDLLELCEDEDITLPRRIGTNPGDGAKAVGQVLAKLYREADGDTLAVDEYEMQRIEREEYDSVERKHRQVKRYVIQETRSEKS